MSYGQGLIVFKNNPNPGSAPVYPVTGADNGLSMNGSIVELGGTLIKTTNIFSNGQTTHFIGQKTEILINDSNGDVFFGTLVDPLNAFEFHVGNLGVAGFFHFDYYKTGSLFNQLLNFDYSLQRYIYGDTMGRDSGLSVLVQAFAANEQFAVGDKIGNYIDINLVTGKKVFGKKTGSNTFGLQSEPTLVTIGDVTANVNKTRQLVDDTAKKMTMIADNGLMVQSSAGAPYLEVYSTGLKLFGQQFGVLPKTTTPVVLDTTGYISIVLGAVTYKVALAV